MANGADSQEAVRVCLPEHNDPICAGGLVCHVGKCTQDADSGSSYRAASAVHPSPAGISEACKATLSGASYATQQADGIASLPNCRCYNMQLCIECTAHVQQHHEAEAHVLLSWVNTNISADVQNLKARRSCASPNLVISNPDGNVEQSASSSQAENAYEMRAAAATVSDSGLRQQLSEDSAMELHPAGLTSFQGDVGLLAHDCPAQDHAVLSRS